MHVVRRNHNHIWNHVRMAVMERSKSVMEKSWNSVFRFLWEPWAWTTPCSFAVHVPIIQFLFFHGLLSLRWFAARPAELKNCCSFLCLAASILLLAIFEVVEQHCSMTCKRNRPPCTVCSLSCNVVLLIIFIVKYSVAYTCHSLIIIIMVYFIETFAALWLKYSL